MSTAGAVVQPLGRDPPLLYQSAIEPLKKESVSHRKENLDFKIGTLHRKTKEGDGSFKK